MVHVILLLATTLERKFQVGTSDSGFPINIPKIFLRKGFCDIIHLFGGLYVTFITIKIPKIGKTDKYSPEKGC